MRTLVLFAASVAYIGYIPVASGTFGSLAGIPLFYAFDCLRETSVPAYVLAFAALVLGTCWIAGRADAYLLEHDSHKIVLDEVAGFVAATLFLAPTAMHIVLAFVIFRALDVFKPFPANYIDRHYPGGYGVTLDDIVSGLYTNLVIRALIGIGWIA